MVEFPSISFSIDLFHQKLSLLFSMPYLLTSQRPLHHLSFFCSQSIIFGPIAQIHENKRIFQQILFNLHIEWGISSETRSIVDFQNYRLQVTVKHDIEPQYFKTHVILDVIRLARAIGMCQNGLD